MPYAIKALALILKIAENPEIIQLAKTAIQEAFDRGEITAEEYQASIKARDEAWERLQEATK